MERKTLLLSANYIPVSIIHWTEAIKLRYENNADVLVEYEENICSPSVTWKLPAVMRLKRMTKRNKSRVVRFSRSGVYIRDNFKCQYCGNRFRYEQLTLDHVTPRSKGGQTTYQNTVAACSKCNCSKGDKSCDEWGHWPLKKPVIPAFLPEPGPRLTSATIPPEWEGFVSAAE
jgi:5-methylcytosine-specific restriction endonuclease McrA